MDKPAQCEAHLQMAVDIGVIKAELKAIREILVQKDKAIEGHVKQGNAWRTAIAGSWVAIITSVVAISFWAGEVNQKVKILDSVKPLSNIKAVKDALPSSLL